jgi:tetratricopeptide (TPR) repeat protein
VIEYLGLSQWGLFVARLAGLAGVAAVLAEAFVRIGTAPGLWLSARPRGPLAVAGLGYLLGCATAGTVYLGLGLTGLFFPALVVAAPVGLVVAARAVRRPGLFLVRAAREAGRIPLAGRLLLVAAVLPAVAVLCVPEWEVDCEVYHLAWPWQMLIAHRALLDHTTFAFHIPLLFDGINALPLVFGDDRPAKWLAAMAFVAGSAVWADRALRRGRPAAAWLGALLAFTAGTVAWMCTSAKSDMMSSACLVAGAVLWLDREWVPAAALMGLALAGKYVYGVYVLLWMIFLPPPRRRWLPVSVACAAAVLPWAAKAWLWMGNPVFPFAATFFPTLDWGGVNDRAFLNPVIGLWWPGTAGWSGMPAAWVALMHGDYLLVFLGLPLLAWSARRDGRAALALLLGTVVALRYGHLSRYLIPAIWPMSCLIAEEAVVLPGRWRPAVLALLTACALGRIAVRPGFWMNMRADAFRPLPEVFRDRLSTRLDLVGNLKRLGTTAGRPLRVLSNGDSRSYRFPCRIVYGGAMGETPLIWSVVHASWTEAGIAKRFRQLGTRHLLHNFVGSEWLSQRNAGWVWSDSMVRRYVRFCLRHLVVEVAPERGDYDNGGFYLFRILGRPLPRAQPCLFYLPGAEQLHGLETTFEDLGRMDDALTEARRVAALIPEVGHAWNRVGHLLTLKADARQGFQVLRPFADLGMIDEMNTGDCAGNAARCGQYRVALRMLARACRVEPSHRTVVLTNEAYLGVAQSVGALNAGRLDRATLFAEQAARALRRIPPGGELTATQDRAIRETTAIIWAVRGEVARVSGRAARASECFRAAWQAAPDHASAARWKYLADSLAPRMFGTGGAR